MTNEKLIIVDDELDMLEGLKRMLGLEMNGIDVLTASSAAAALELIRESPVDLVLSDIRMPDLDGLELLDALKKDDPWLTIILMTGHGSIDLAVEAMKKGAYDFVTKPFELPALIRVLTKGLERNRLIRENRNLRLRLGEAKELKGFVGQSASMRLLYQRIEATARTDYPTLVCGESGTGKELAARAIHALSKRKHRPMITVNCPAIPEHLLESELFGYKKGAFTGAEQDHPGLFREADAGTLFLDEIADIPVSIQTKLLRILQEQELRPLGAKNTSKVDVRIIAATNQDIEAAIQDRRFREDLYYRLNVVPIRMPPLRERVEDIPLLANHFAKMASRELDLPPRRFMAEALEKMIIRPWPGNVRELQNLVRRVVMFSPEAVIRPEDLKVLEEPGPPAGPGRNGPPVTGIIQLYKDAKEKVVNEFTQSYVADLLEQTGGNVSRAAELSGLGRASLQKIMRRMGIKSENYKNDG